MSPACKVYSLTVFLCLFVWGCSSTNNPGLPSAIEPDHSPGLAAQKITNQTSAGSRGHYLWAFYQFFVDLDDPDGPKLEAVPVRMGARHWNVLRFLEQGPCNDCIRIAGVTSSGTGTLLVDVEITHPFDLANFTGFDVRGIVMFSGTHLFPEHVLITSDRSSGEGELVNADGFTFLYNGTTGGLGPNGLEGYIKGKYATQLTPNSTLNGYKRHISPGAAKTRNAFYAGGSLIETYELDMPDGPFVFGYAVDANWAPPSHKPVEDPMTDFPPEANCPEPWKIEVSDTPIDQGLTDHGGSTVLSMSVYDWQGKDTHELPLVECPELFDGLVEAQWVEDGDGFSTFEATVENQKLAPVGEYKCLIAVEDQENATSSDWMDLTAYQLYTLEVSEYVVQNHDPIACAEASPNPQTVCESVSFDAACSTDPDGEEDIVLYEWDFDSDGTYGDKLGLTTTWVWYEVGTYYVQLRVTDSQAATDILDEPLEVVIENALPTAVAEAADYTVYAGEGIDFDGTSSHDNDCGQQSIVLHEWDFDYDGVFETDSQDAQPHHQYDSPGDYDVMLRVTDDEGGTSLLDAPLDIHVYENLPPVAVAEAGKTSPFIGETVHFDGTASHDNDCDSQEIVQWEWDWENDGVFDETGPTAGHQFDQPKKYEVQLRVTDDEGSTDTLDEPLEIWAVEGWARTWGGVSTDKPNSIAVDTSGDVYVTGSFQGEVDFDPGEGEFIRASNGYTDAFISKFDSMGDFLWAATWGSVTGSEEGLVVIVDTDGFAYVAGSFESWFDFNPGAGEEIHSSKGGKDAFVSKFGADGTFYWAKTWGSAGYEEARALGVQTFSGTLFVAGCFENEVDFDPGPGVTTRTSNGFRDAYFLVLGTNGSFTAVYSWGGSGQDEAHGLSLDASADIYITGRFHDTVDFNPYTASDPRTSNGQDDVFLSCFDFSGSYEWVRTWGGTLADRGLAVYACKVSSDVYVSGYFNLTVDFDPGGSVDNHSSNGSEDAFLSKLDSSGTFKWARTWGGVSGDKGTALYGDTAADYICVIGDFYGTVDFDPGAGTVERISNGITDIFLLQLDDLGSFQWVNTWGSTVIDAGHAIVLDSDNTIFAAGRFQETLDFNLGPGVDEHSSNGFEDVYLVRYPLDGQW